MRRDCTESPATTGRPGPPVHNPAVTPAPVLIGIAGGSGSGKTYLARFVKRKVGSKHAAVLSMDQYFTSLTDQERRLDPRDINFDHPAHIDIALLEQHLLALKQGESVQVPHYDFRTQVQTPAAETLAPHRVILVEGLFLLAQPLVQRFDLTIFLHVDPDQRLIGRLLRDLHERESSIAWNIDRYQRFVRPSYEAFVQPTVLNADLVVDFTYRRVFFQEMLAHMVRDYVRGHFDLEHLVQSVRGDGWVAGTDKERPQQVNVVDLAELIRRSGRHQPTEHVSDPAYWAADNPELNNTAPPPPA